MSEALDRVRRVVAGLLDPEGGCPWDRKQTPESLRMYILEETYELLAAVEDGSAGDVCEELGDVFFLLSMLSAQYEKSGDFTMDDALTRAADKMVARHPHVFGEARRLGRAEEVRQQWHEMKRREKSGSILAGVPAGLPALLQAHRLSERAGRVGFDWPDPAGVLESVGRELDELREAADQGGAERTAEELGDLLFTLANLGRRLEIGSEDALRRANRKFRRRFEYIEQRIAEQGRTLDEADLEEMDRYWDEAKKKGL